MIMRHSKPGFTTLIQVITLESYMRSSHDSG